MNQIGPKQNLFFNERGQAIMEYLMIILFIAFLSVKMVTAYNKILDTTFKSLAKVLTQHLNIGVCESRCFSDGYQNK